MMKRILFLFVISLAVSSTAAAFQGGGGESTKKKTVAKKPAAAKVSVSKPHTSIVSPASTRRSVRPSARSAAPVTAELTIRSSQPSSLILINGESVGVTDGGGELDLSSFKPGVYKVSASKEGYQLASKQITLSAGRKGTVVLEQAIASQSLSVVSSPTECDIYVDDVLRGRTDASGKATLSDIAVGEHTVTIRRFRYSEASFPVSVSLDKEAQITANLAAVGFLTVTTNAPNASIEIYGIGNFAGSARNVECPPGTYTVSVSSPGYETSSKEVLVVAGQEVQFNPDLLADADHRAGYSETMDPVVQPSMATSTLAGSFLVPSGIIISGILENEINTKDSKDNDRFRMTVTGPDEFRGATIEGYISGVHRAGKVAGQSKITFNFERITLRKGQTFEFAGTLRSLADKTGKPVKVDNEGTAKGESQTKQTAKRTGVGAGIGAVLGGILGGGTGAAIGAAVGGGVGAASAAVENNDIKLSKGSAISVQSSSPGRRNKTPIP